VSYNALRNDPNIKQYHKDLVEKSNELIKETGAYEVLLINNKGFVTEGNKSNIFFVKNNEIYTAPDNMVLEGITRKKIIQIAKDLNIKIRFDAVQYNNINTFDSAFLTGTSPKVLKICCIDNINFRTENEIIEKISYEYDLQINKYISSHKMNKKCTKY